MQSLHLYFDLNERLVSLAPRLDSSERNVFRDSLVNLTVSPCFKGACKGLPIESALHRIDHLLTSICYVHPLCLVGLNYLINNCVSYGTIPLRFWLDTAFLIARTDFLTFASRCY